MSVLLQHFNAVSIAESYDGPDKNQTSSHSRLYFN